MESIWMIGVRTWRFHRHLSLLFLKKMSQNLSSLSLGDFFFLQRKKTAFILNRKVFPSHRLSSELFENIQDLKENFQS